MCRIELYRFLVIYHRDDDITKILVAIITILGGNMIYDHALLLLIPNGFNIHAITADGK